MKLHRWWDRNFGGEDPVEVIAWIAFDIFMGGCLIWLLVTHLNLLPIPPGILPRQIPSPSNATLPPPGNYTASSITQVFTSVVQSTGIPPILFFLWLFAPIAYLMRKSTMGMIGAFGAWMFFGVFVGILPIWLVFIPGALFVIEAARIFRGEFDDGGSREYFIHPTDEPLEIVKTPEIHLEPKTENCENCGGPNVGRVTCEWCGKVL